METINDTSDYEAFVRSTWTNNVNDDFRPFWAAGELSAETGEVAGVAIKAIRKGKPLDVEKFKDELGDVLWSLTAAALSVGTDLNGLMYHNFQKLSARVEAGYYKESINPENYHGA